MGKRADKDYIERNNKKYYKTSKNYIYRCEDGYYCYRIYHKASKTNSFVTKNLDDGSRFDTDRDAEKALYAHIYKIENNIAYKNLDITFADLWNEYKEKSARDESTITKYESMFKHHVSYEFGNVAIRDITFGDINNYLEKMYKMGDGHGTKQNGYSFSFVEGFVKYFWLIFNYAFSKKIISADDLKLLLDNIKMPKEIDARKIRILNNEQIHQVYDLLRDTDFLLPFLVSLYTAARPAEAFAVRFSDFDFENKKLNITRQIVEFQGALTFKDPKTFSRLVPIPDALIYEVKKRKVQIEKAKKENPALFELNRKKVIYSMKRNSSGVGDIYDDMICTDFSGRYVAPSSFQYYAKIIRRDICCNDDWHEDFSFYCFRKTAISIMAAHNIPIGNLMKITGHKKNETLFQYYYNDENVYAEAKVSEALESLNHLI